jgi:hypothetical protein
MQTCTHFHPADASRERSRGDLRLRFPSFGKSGAGDVKGVFSRVFPLQKPPRKTEAAFVVLRARGSSSGSDRRCKRRGFARCDSKRAHERCVKRASPLNGIGVFTSRQSKCRGVCSMKRKRKQKAKRKENGIEV